MVKKDGAILTSGCDTRPWSLLDIINTTSFVEFRLLLTVYSNEFKVIPISPKNNSETKVLTALVFSSMVIYLRLHVILITKANRKNWPLI